MNRKSLLSWVFFLLFIPRYYSSYFIAFLWEEEEESSNSWHRRVNTKERKLPQDSAGSLISSTGLSFFCKQQIKAVI